MVRIELLGPGARFKFANAQGKESVWEIIGRPGPSGQDEKGNTVFTVKAIYVPRFKGDPDAELPKYFNVKYEVEIVTGPRKTIAAVDSRDQPESPVTFKELGLVTGTEEALKGLTEEEEVASEQPAPMKRKRDGS